MMARANMAIKQIASCVVKWDWQESTVSSNRTVLPCSFWCSSQTIPNPFCDSMITFKYFFPLSLFTRSQLTKILLVLKLFSWCTTQVSNTNILISILKQNKTYISVNYYWPCFWWLENALLILATFAGLVFDLLLRIIACGSRFI